jgi:subtilisin-like proprotein convertase family protein/uncharacterized protein (DUF2141 family)
MNATKKIQCLKVKIYRTQVIKLSISIWMLLSLVLALLAPSSAIHVTQAAEPSSNVLADSMDQIDATYTYENTDSGNMTDNACATFPNTRYFLVPDHFTITDLNVGINISHTNRGDIKVTLTSPKGTVKDIILSGTDADDNYDILLDADSANPLDDNSADTVASPYYDRTVGQTKLNDFEGEDAHGAWLLYVCDNVAGTGGQTFNRAQLAFTGTPIQFIAPIHHQGPAIVETYFVPWPENQVWTAMGRIFTNNSGGCSDFSSYDSVPRQPMISYTVLTITDINTVITYDQWEDGYEASLTFPSQTTTEVWGDGDLLNGVAPGDADDVLDSGQIVTLNDVMDSSTLGSVIDFDARDKIAASQPIAVSRSVWADGSATLFAAADEVYPVDRWGIEYRSPVGDNASLNGMFEYSGVSIIAATNGTLVDIDLAGDGTYETTGIALNQGGTYQIDDNTNGIDRGGRIRSNSGHPIQVNLMTADVCAGFESRTYPLLPLANWSNSYYSPVGTTTSNPGAPSNDDAPTTVSLYNPNDYNITAYYQFASGAASSVSVTANNGTDVGMNDLTGAHFWAVRPAGTTTNDMEDQFASQNYNLNTGSVNWATNWSETGDDNSASAGTIYITPGVLRFRESSATNDAIQRTADLSGGYTSATLSFTLNGTNIDASPDDDIKVQISSNGGSTWNDLATYSSANDPNGSTVSFNVTSYIASNTTVRFIMVGSLETGTGDGEYWDFDNVNITFSYTTQETTANFYAVASVDSDNASGTGDDRNDTYDWGITLVPESALSQFLIVGWAPGDDPTYRGTAPENTAPIWFTGGHPTGSTSPSATFDICIDYNGDGGATLDAVTGKYYNRKITGVAPRAQLKIYKNIVAPPDSPPGTAGDDQTGTQIWVCGPTTPGPGDLATDAIITAAWGEDPLDAAPGRPGIDMGYTVRNQRTWRATKSASLQVDVNGNGLYDEGDTIRYTITVANTSASGIASLIVTDDVPTNATYVTNSTYLTNDGSAPPSSGQIPDSGTGTPFPLDNSGYTYTNLNSFKSFVITFDMTINTGASQDPGTVTNVAHITDGTITINPEVTITVQAPKPGAIGNYVWLDEDGDGDQDAGETGIPNMKVDLCSDSACTSILATTYTDANGGYLFPDLSAGTYYVRTTPAAGLNATYDENGTGTLNITTVSLSPGEEHLTADFGYNWNTASETNNNTGTAAIGDKVWVDIDGDGFQDAEEIGIYNVSVQLITAGTDGVIGTGDDVVSATTTTDYNGNYLFDGLTAGSYAVKINPTNFNPGGVLNGWTQTGDPDHFGTTGTNDNQTTVPVVLSPGDVFVNADFGYKPADGTTGSIGDTVWVDIDRGNDVDAGEPRLAGVTVALIMDLDGDGTWDAGEPIIATDITDVNGVYGFSGLPVTDGAGTDDYLVWVNDTDNVLAELVPTYDVRDAGSQGNPTTGVRTGLEISAVTNLITTAVTDADFAYAPTGHDASEGLIGDTVFLDINANGSFDAGEGLEGVLVRLYASDGTTLLAATTTNENGQYFFGGLTTSAGGTSYVVQVQTATLPYPGLTNTVDPDGGNNSSSVVSLTTAVPVNLAQDFGYRDTSSPNSISGTIWNDTNADGTLTEAGRFDGVTVVLRDSSGDIVATTTTTGGGNYSFTNLPDGTYSIDVTDTGNVLNGYWKSTGGNPGSDNNSQIDPYTVTVSGGQTNTTADFGYYVIPAALGNFVWQDLDGDGIQDGGELGIPNVPVTLTITWPNSAGTTTLTTVTDSSGYYSFGNLLLDEDYPASGGVGQPAMAITLTPPAGYISSPINQTTEELDSDNPAGETAIATKGSTNNSYDFGLVKPGSIGNYVWLDEDGDSDQDAGEAGIPNAPVQLCADAACSIILATTYTDANGGYLFPNLLPATYYVKVTPPSGLNPTYDENGTGTPNITTVALTVGEEHLTADFGYNWSTTTETNTPGSGATGSIGDRVWSDANSNGVQDPEEVGIQGVTVVLYTAGTDGLFGTGDDVLVATSTTDPNGNYIFDNLAPDSYVVKVTAPVNYTQIGDPDNFGAVCSLCDNQTTSPIVLAPGDVFVDADFGYHAANNAGSIGDTLWVDADRGGDIDATETRLPGVTVSLIKDSNGDGLWDPNGLDNIMGTADDEAVIATDITNATGMYLFNGLPANGIEDYLVWVNDTNNVLTGLVPTYDSNGIATPNISTVSNLTPAGNLLQDFGYAPPLQDVGDGLIGDTIWLDTNGSGTYNVGEGMEGVVVRLYASDGTTLVATTVTNENGQYFFGNLSPTATYVVKVDTTTLPYTGLTNFVDPDGGNNSTSTVNLAATGPVDLNQDFGYRDESTPNTISGTIWKDINSDGVQDAGETGRFPAGITVVLYNSAGNVVATTTTDGSGNYSFSNLPDGTYTVDVTDDLAFTNGYWKSNCPTANCGQDGFSQVDPYSVTVGPANRNDVTADFGYFYTPAAIGNWIWADSNADGIQDGTESGIPGVVVKLTITYPNGATITLETKTDSTGYYNFTNLLLDEDLDGLGSGEPTFSLSVQVPAGYQLTKLYQGSDTEKDSDDPAGTAAYPVKGNTLTSYDFGFNPTPTSVTVTDFNATFLDPNNVQVQWTSLFEQNVLGYRLYRATALDGTRTLVNVDPIPAQGSDGAIYTYVDTNVTSAESYYYWLVGLIGPSQNEQEFAIEPAFAAYVTPRLWIPIIVR